MWTLFWDMHSGGRTKVKTYNKIYIEAGMPRSARIFEERFARNPNNITCDCCGEDYSISEEKTLEQVSAFHRNGYNSSIKSQTIEEYMKREDVLVIFAKNFTAEEQNA